jgi:hypothetical protein
MNEKTKEFLEDVETQEGEIFIEETVDEFTNGKGEE